MFFFQINQYDFFKRLQRVFRNNERPGEYRSEPSFRKKKKSFQPTRIVLLSTLNWYVLITIFGTVFVDNFRTVNYLHRLKS